MKHSNVLAAALNTVWYSTDEQITEIARIINGISAGEIAQLRRDFQARVEAGEFSDSGPSGVEYRGNTAIVPIMGVISKRMNLMQYMSGGTSTDLLTHTFKALEADDSIKNVILNVDSDGGNVEGVEIATRALRSLREKKKVIAIANDHMNSAAYYIASAAHKIFVTPSSSIGSIGTLQILAEKSKQLEDSGITVKVIRAGKYKALYNGTEPFTDEALEMAQETVNKYHLDFIKAVSINRNISMDKATKLADGRVYDGEKAVEAGIADGVSTLDEILASIDAEEDANLKLDVAKTSITNLHSVNATLEANLAELTKKIEAQEAALETLRAQIKENETKALKEAVSAIVAAAINDGKIAAAKEEDFVNLGMAHGIDHIKMIFDAIPKGAVKPVAPIEEANSDEAAKAAIDADPNYPVTEQQKRLFAQSPFLREKYKLHAYVKK